MTEEIAIRIANALEGIEVATQAIAFFIFCGIICAAIVMGGNRS